MNILRIEPAYYPAFRYGGPIQSVHLLDKALLEKGVKVDVLATTAGQVDGSVPVNVWTLADGVRTKYCQYFGYEHYTFSPGLFWESLKIAKGYDLIITDAVWNFPALVAYLVSKLYRKPFIIVPHGVLYKETVEMKSKYKKLLYWALFAKHYVNGASGIQFTTRDEQEKVLAYFNVKAHSFLVPNGIQHSAFESLPSLGGFSKKYPVLTGKSYILFLGRITQKKGLDLLVEAFEKLYRDYPDLRLVIVGPDNEGYGVKVKSWLKKKGILDRTLFTGMLLGEDMLSALVDAEAFVLPSYSENFGMAVVEAMSCGTPVVISDNVGIYREVRENNAGIVVQANPDSVYSGIKTLLDDRKLRAQISMTGKKMVRDYYDIDVIADQMIKEFDAMLC